MEDMPRPNITVPYHRVSGFVDTPKLKKKAPVTVKHKLPTIMHGGLKNLAINIETPLPRAKHPQNRAAIEAPCVGVKFPLL